MLKCSHSPSSPATARYAPQYIEYAALLRSKERSTSCQHTLLLELSYLCMSLCRGVKPLTSISRSILGLPVALPLFLGLGKAWSLSPCATGRLLKRDNLYFVQYLFLDLFLVSIHNRTKNTISSWDILGVQSTRISDKEDVGVGSLLFLHTYCCTAVQQLCYFEGRSMS